MLSHATTVSSNLVSIGLFFEGSRSYVVIDRPFLRRGTGSGVNVKLPVCTPSKSLKLPYDVEGYELA